MKTSALSAISQAGAINAEQMLQLVQGNLKKAEDGSVKVLMVALSKTSMFTLPS